MYIDKIFMKGVDLMGRPKGTKNKRWSKEEKLEIVLKNVNEHIGTRTLAKMYEIDGGMIRRWIRTYLELGENGLENKKKTGNIFAAIYSSKSLSEEERLKLIVMKQEIEIERLKKGYFVKGVGANKEFVTLKEKNMKS